MMIQLEMIDIRKAKKQDLFWVNTKYAEVNFELSVAENELIIIAELNNTKCGIGRLVIINEQHLELGGIYVFEEYRGKGIAEKIVRFLCTENKFKQSTIWCLPFSNLKKFYEGFGFTEDQNESEAIPKKIVEKRTWCNQTYNIPVLLFNKENNRTAQ